MSCNTYIYEVEHSKDYTDIHLKYIGWVDGYDFVDALNSWINVTNNHYIEISGSHLRCALEDIKEITIDDDKNYLVSPSW